MDPLACRRLFAGLMMLSLFGTVPEALRAQEAEATTEPVEATSPAVAPALHRLIDRLAVSQWPHLAAGPAPDGIFLRRLSLDLRGVVPTGEELAAFIADPAPDKRTTWVERFLADPLHQERMVDWLDKTLMQRRPHAQVDRGAWLKWLREKVEAKTTMDQLVVQVLTADWWNNSQRPELRFFLERTGDPHLITRDLSRVLLGRDMQCNQCHNHPLVDEYKQLDYQGMLAFVSSSSMVEGSTKDDKGAEVKSQLYIERPSADAPFESVFDKGVVLRTGPRLPVSPELLEEYLEPDARLKPEMPEGAFTGVPKPPVHSRRALLAKQLIDAEPRLLARNFANRIWAITFGRGLVHPLDMHHADNPAVHPELLEELTTAFLEMRFDYDRLLKELVLSDLYGRDSEIKFQPWPIAETQAITAGQAELSEIAVAAGARQSSLTAILEAARAKAKAAEKALEESESSWRQAQSARNAARAELDSAEAAFNDVKKKSDEAQAAHSAAAKKQQDTLARISLLDEAVTKLAQALALAGDAELTAASNTAKTKAEAARGELPTLEKATADTKAAADGALAAVDAPRATMREKATALAAQQTALASVDTAYTAARQTWSIHRSRVAVLDRQLLECEHCLTLVEQIEAARRLATERTAAESQLVAEQSKLPDLQSQVKLASDALDAGNQKFAEAMTALAAAKAALANHESELAQLRETLAQLEKATRLVSTPDPLRAASGTIQDTLVARTSATAGLASAVGQLEESVAVATNQLAALQAARAGADQALAAQQTLITNKQAEHDAQAKSVEEAISQSRDAWQTVLEDQQIQLAIGATRALSPEQLGQSILRVTGIFDNYVSVEQAELQKSSPLPDNADAAMVATRQLHAVRGAGDKLRGNIDVFASLYASGVGQTTDEYFASPDQALYMANGGAVFPWSGPNGQNVTARMIANPDNAAAARDLYTTLLAREPLPTETALIAEQLTNAGADRAAVCQELVWAILTSVEFRFYR